MQKQKYKVSEMNICSIVCYISDYCVSIFMSEIDLLQLSVELDISNTVSLLASLYMHCPIKL